MKGKARSVGPWWFGLLVVAVTVGLVAYQSGADVVGAILAGLLTVPVGEGGRLALRRMADRRGGGGPGRTGGGPAAIGGLLAGLLTVLALFLAAGCGSAQQRVVSSVALAAVAVDREAAEVYDRRAREEIERQAADGGTLAAWCEAIRPTWEIVARVECGAVALADAAIAGQRLLDAAGGEVDGPAWIAWVAPVGAVVGAVVAGWEAVDPGGPPAELRQAWGLVEALAGGSDLAPVCDVPPVPGCEEVTP